MVMVLRGGVSDEIVILLKFRLRRECCVNIKVRHFHESKNSAGRVESVNRQFNLSSSIRLKPLSFKMTEEFSDKELVKQIKQLREEILSLKRDFANSLQK